MDGMGDVLYIYTFEVTFEPQRREGPQYHLSELRGRREGVSFVGGRCHDSTFVFLARISRMTRFFRLFVVALRTWAPNFLLHTILRRGVDFAFDLDALTKIDEQADFNAGRLEIVDELGLMCGMQVFDGFEFEDDLVFHDDVGHVVADQLTVVIDLDLLFLFGAETGFQELDQEGILIDDFKEAEAEGVVDLVGTGNDLVC
jgi:hypothetical protein